MQEDGRSMQNSGAFAGCWQARADAREEKGRSPKAPAVWRKPNEGHVRGRGTADYGRAGAARNEDARTSVSETGGTRPGDRDVERCAMGNEGAHLCRPYEHQQCAARDERSAAHQRDKIQVVATAAADVSRLRDTRPREGEGQSKKAEQRVDHDRHSLAWTSPA